MNNDNTSILKYPLTDKSFQHVKMPWGAQLLTAQYQESTGQIVLWARVKPLNPDTLHVIWLVATGSEIPNDFDARYLNTIQTPSGLVWHVFTKET